MTKRPLSSKGSSWKPNSWLERVSRSNSRPKADGKLFLAVELRFQFGPARETKADKAIPAGMLGEAQDATVAAVLHGLAEKQAAGQSGPCRPRANNACPLYPPNDTFLVTPIAVSLTPHRTKLSRPARTHGRDRIACRRNAQ